MKAVHSSVHHHLIDKLIIVSSFVSGISLFPEILRVLTIHRESSMADASLLIILMNSLVWLIYGLHCRLQSLIISSSLSILTSGFLFASGFLYH